MSDRPKFIYWIIFMPCIIVASIILVISINHASKAPDALPHDKRLRRISGMALIFYFLCGVSYLVDELVNYPPRYHYIPHNIALILRCLAHALLYLLFSERIRITLRDTVYYSPCYVFVIVYTTVAVHVGGHSAVIFAYTLDMEMHHKVFDSLIQLHFISYVILSMFLLCLFTKKLMLLTVTVADTLGVQSLPNTPKFSDHHMKNKTPTKWGSANLSALAMSSVNDRMPTNIKRTSSKAIAHHSSLSTIRETGYLHLVTKLTILLLWTTIMTDISLIYDTIMYGEDKTIMDETRTESFHFIRGILFSVDNISNCIVMFLSFEFAKRYYLKCCCCDKCCNRCCVRITSRNSIQQWAELELNRANQYTEIGEDDAYTEIDNYQLQQFTTTVKLK